MHRHFRFTGSAIALSGLLAVAALGCDRPNTDQNNQNNGAGRTNMQPSNAADDYGHDASAQGSDYGGSPYGGPGSTTSGSTGAGSSTSENTTSSSASDRTDGGVNVGRETPASQETRPIHTGRSTKALPKNRSDSGTLQ